MLTNNQPPTISWRELVSVVSSPGLCGATNVTLGAPTTSDNCGAVASITKIGRASCREGAKISVGAASFNKNNTAICPQLVIVTNNQPPSITCPARVTEAASTGFCGA